MTGILLLYATRSGSTGEVADFIAQILTEAGITVDTHLADNFTDDIHDYDAVILGSPIYKGVWLTSLWRTVRRLETQFKDKPVWGFSLCMRILEVEGQTYAEANYLPHSLLDKLNLQSHRFFRGRLENLSLALRQELHETYDGELGLKEGDYRDWEAIRAWALEIAGHFK